MTIHEIIAKWQEKKLRAIVNAAQRQTEATFTMCELLKTLFAAELIDEDDARFFTSYSDESYGIRVEEGDAETWHKIHRHFGELEQYYISPKDYDDETSNLVTVTLTPKDGSKWRNILFVRFTRELKPTDKCQIVTEVEEEPMKRRINRSVVCNR